MDKSEFRREVRKTIGSALGIAKPVIKVLIYTDDPTMITDDDLLNVYGIDNLKQHIMQHSPAFANVSVKLIDRNFGGQPAVNKLDRIWSKEVFDEIWFFGM